MMQSYLLAALHRSAESGIARVSACYFEQVVFSHSLNARGRSIASGETEVVSPAKHKRDNAEAIFS
jgi:hypothetical protein